MPKKEITPLQFDYMPFDDEIDGIEADYQMMYTNPVVTCMATMNTHRENIKYDEYTQEKYIEKDVGNSKIKISSACIFNPDKEQKKLNTHAFTIPKEFNIIDNPLTTLVFYELLTIIYSKFPSDKKILAQLKKGEDIIFCNFIEFNIEDFLYKKLDVDPSQLNRSVKDKYTREVKKIISAIRDVDICIDDFGSFRILSADNVVSCKNGVIKVEVTNTFVKYCMLHNITLFPKDAYKLTLNSPIPIYLSQYFTFLYFMESNKKRRDENGTNEHKIKLISVINALGKLLPSEEEVKKSDNDLCKRILNPVLKPLEMLKENGILTNYRIAFPKMEDNIVRASDYYKFKNAMLYYEMPSPRKEFD